MTNPTYVHPNALCESEDVGAGTRVWAFAHVMKGAHVGRDCNIGDHAFVETGAWVGDGVTVKNQVMVWNGVRIDDGAFIGPGAIFTNDRYARSPRNSDVPAIARRYADPKGWLAATRVGRGATIGAGAVIVCGIAIGPYATVGAGAVVTRDVGAHVLVAGNPARAIGYVGRAGLKLAQDADGLWRCPETGERYRAHTDGLALADS